MSPCPLSRTTLFTMRPSRSNSPKRAGVVEDETDQLLEESKELLDAKQNIEAKESSDSKPKARDTNKCAKCKSRLARKGCCQLACLQCCSDQDCEGHAESREKQKYHDDLLTGNTEIALKAKRQRDLALLPNVYREPGFIYSQQTIKIWDIREFMANPKWKEDAIRKSTKRKAYKKAGAEPQIKISRKRFRSFMDNWYRSSIK